MKMNFIILLLQCHKPPRPSYSHLTVPNMLFFQRRTLIEFWWKFAFSLSNKRENWISLHLNVWKVMCFLWRTFAPVSCRPAPALRVKDSYFIWWRLTESYKELIADQPLHLHRKILFLSAFFFNFTRSWISHVGCRNVDCLCTFLHQESKTVLKRLF